MFLFFVSANVLSEFLHTYMNAIHFRIYARRNAIQSTRMTLISRVDGYRSLVEFRTGSLHYIRFVYKSFFIKLFEDVTDIPDYMMPYGTFIQII